MARLILTSPMARVATSDLIQRLETALRLFPELGDEPVTVGLTTSRWLDGLALPDKRFIRLNPLRRRRVTNFTIGHELTHLLQPPGLPLIPSGEVQCDIWTLARDGFFLDEKPTYLQMECDGRSWKRHAPAVQRLCRQAIAERARNRRYIVWLKRQLGAYFQPGASQPDLFGAWPVDF